MFDKDINIDDICIRLRQSFDYLRLNEVLRTQEDMTRQTGILQPHIAAAFRCDPKRLTKGFLKKFIDAYGEYISAEWLMTGEGEMERKDPRKFKPDVPVRVAAGFIGGSVESALISGCEMYPTIPFLPTYDFTIRVSGDSMLPNLEDNDLIACRYVDDLSEIKPNKIYVVDTADGAAVKMIRLEGESLVCTSLNPKYDTYTLPIANVIKVAQVVGAVKNY